MDLLKALSKLQFMKPNFAYRSGLIINSPSKFRKPIISIIDHSYLKSGGQNLNRYVLKNINNFERLND